MMTWRRGTGILMQKTRRTEVPLDSLVHSLEKKPPHVVPGTAVFLTSDPDFAPTALLHNLKHNKVLHEHNVILTIIFADTPRVPQSERVTITPVSDRFSRVALKFGFMDEPNVPKALAIARKHGWTFDIMSTSFFLSRRAIKAAAHSGHAEMAGPDVHRAGQVRDRRHRLLPDPDRTGDGGRHAGDGLSRSASALSYKSLYSTEIIIVDRLRPLIAARAWLAARSAHGHLRDKRQGTGLYPRPLMLRCNKGAGSGPTHIP